MSTTLAKPSTVARKWFLIDAAGKPMGIAVMSPQTLVCAEPTIWSALTAALKAAGRQLGHDDCLRLNGQQLVHDGMHPLRRHHCAHGDLGLVLDRRDRR